MRSLCACVHVCVRVPCLWRASFIACVCAYRNWPVWVCARVLKNYGLNCQKGQTEVVVNQVMNLDFLIFIYCWLKRICCDSGGSRVMWLERRLIPKQQNCGGDHPFAPATTAHVVLFTNQYTLHPSPRGRYNLFHFIADLWIYACLYNRCLMYTIYCMCTCNSILIICSFQREIKRCFGVMVRTLQNCLAKIVHFCMYVYVTSW